MFTSARARAARLGLFLFLFLGIAAATPASAWWTASPDSAGSPVWLDVSPNSDNTHGYLAKRMIDLLAGNGRAVGAELNTYRADFYYGVWVEDFATGDSTGDTLWTAAHYWDGGNGAPAIAQQWFVNAVAVYRLGNKALAYEFLGRASHYVQDVTQPFHAAHPVDPSQSGVGCFHQPFYGVSDYRSHCHSVVELHATDQTVSIVVPSVPSFTRSSQPAYDATAWAREVHGRGDSRVATSIDQWHVAIRNHDFATVNARLPTLYGRAIAATAGLAETFWARTR